MITSISAQKYKNGGTVRKDGAQSLSINLYLTKPKQRRFVPIVPNNFFRISLVDIEFIWVYNDI